MSEEQTVQIEPTTLKLRKLRWIDILNVLMLLAIVLYVGYAKLYPFNVIDVTNLNSQGKIPMLTERVQAGTYAKYDIKTQRHTSETITVIRSIVNGQTIPLGASLSNRPAGPGAFVVEVLIPPNLNPGKYHFRICYQSDYALDRKVTECFETESFQVYLPPGVSPDSDGLTVPQEGTQNLPQERGSPVINYNFNEDNPNTGVNLVETPKGQDAAEQAENTTTNPGGVFSPENSLCMLTGLTLQQPIGLPLKVC